MKRENLQAAFVGFVFVILARVIMAIISVDNIVLEWIISIASAAIVMAIVILIQKRIKKRNSSEVPE